MKQKLKIQKGNKGITLMALVITIIVLLILAGVSIGALTGDNGTLVNSNKAKFMTEVRAIQEEIGIAEIQRNGGEDYKFGTLEKIIGRTDEYNEILSMESGNMVYDPEKVSENQAKWLEDMDIHAKQNIIPIYTKEQFWKIGSGENIEIDEYIYNFSLSAKYQLQNNINLECSEENQWIAIGNQANPFSGTLDGQNYTISGIYISNDKTYQGIFGFISGTAKNIVIKDSYVASSAGRAYIGNLAGKSTSTSQIINCINQGKVESANSVGGLIGENHGLISNCINEGEIVGINADVGGIVGDNYGTIILCKNKGKISSGTGCRGGIAGINQKEGEVIKCINEGNLSENSSGGIAGSNGGRIEECYNNGIVGFGGICQTNKANGIIINCYNIQENKGTNSWAAGLAGHNKGTIKNCYNLGKARNGLVGYNEGTIENCYYLSSASTKMQAGENTGTLTNSGEKTEEEMKNDEFVNQLNENGNQAIWVKDKNNINNGYPIFNWQSK